MYILKVIKSKFTVDVLAIREGLAGPDSLMLLLPNYVCILTVYDKVYERIRSDMITAVLVAVVNPHF